MTMTLKEETKSIRTGMIVKTPKGETEKAKATIQKIMKKRRELEVLLEGKDPIEMIETIKEEIIVQIGGETPVEESPALIEGNMLLREGADGIIAQIKDQKEGEIEVEGNTLLRKGGDILGQRGEGVARDPMVQEDP